MALIRTEELRDRIKVVIPMTAPYNASADKKKENIDSFNALSREGLQNDKVERRILLYRTQAGEKVYMQYPGIESAREGIRAFPLDARPVLQKADGTYAADMDFKKIWDIIDRIGEGHRDDIDILATIFLRIAYMLDYKHNDQEYLCEELDIENDSVSESEHIRFVWNSLELDQDVLETLNDRFNTQEGMSIEGFLYYNDLLAQNEDCKYHYIQGDRWTITAGRINNCLSHLTVISHIRGKIGISKLIDSFQRTGVAPLPQSRFEEACGELVERR